MSTKSEMTEYYIKSLIESQDEARAFHSLLMDLAVHKPTLDELLAYREVAAQRIAVIEILKYEMEEPDPQPKKTWKFWKK